MVAMVRALRSGARLSRLPRHDTRATGILAGAALAPSCPANAAFTTGTVRKLDVLGVVAAVGLGVAWCTLRGENPFLYHGGLWLTELARWSSSCAR